MAASVAGLAALQALRPAERALVRGEPPFAARRLVAAALRRAGVRLSPRRQQALAALVECCYGTMWAMAYAWARPHLDWPRGRRVAALVAAIGGLELLTLPWLVGRRLLRPRVLAALGLHVLGFALAVDRTVERVGAATASA